MEGSVRKVGNRLRVTAQLVEAETGTHLWAAQMTALEDVFEFQDQITERWLASSSRACAVGGRERSSETSQNLDAYDLFLRAMPVCTRGCRTKVDSRIPLLGGALSLDPDYPAAQCIAWCHESVLYARVDSTEADRYVALFHARTIGSDTDDAAALAVAGWVVIVVASINQLASLGDRARFIVDPSCATAQYFAALVNSFANKPEATAFDAKQALRLSPSIQRPSRLIWHWGSQRLGSRSSRMPLLTLRRRRKSVLRIALLYRCMQSLWRLRGAPTNPEA